MRIGVCTSPESLKKPVEGLAYVEPTVAGVLCPKDDEAAFEKRAAAAKSCPLPFEAVNCLLPGDLKTAGTVVDLAPLDAYMTVVCRRAQKLGIRILVFGSGGSRRVPNGFMPAAAAVQIVSHLTRWGPLAARHNVTIVVEPLNKAECNIINSVDEAADLVRRANHPHIRLLCDTYHMVRDGDSPDSIRRARGIIAHVHCAEGKNRLSVGLSGEDHRAYFKALKDIGYNGRISIEARWDDFEKQIAQAVAELRKQIDSA